MSFKPGAAALQDSSRMMADAPVAKSVDAQDLMKIEPDRESGSVKPFKFGETPAPTCEATPSQSRRDGQV